MASNHRMPRTARRANADSTRCLWAGRAATKPGAAYEPQCSTCAPNASIERTSPCKPSADRLISMGSVQT
jgi:hypothetical protein